MSRPASEILNQEFLLARAKILELAATFDRLDRAEGDWRSSPRADLLKQGVAILLENEEGRAERLQLLFSRPYKADWRSEFEV